MLHSGKLYNLLYAERRSHSTRDSPVHGDLCRHFSPGLLLFPFLEKATKEGALASLWTGALASLFAMLFLHKAEAGAVGLCNMLSGRDVLIDIYPWFAIDPILFALPLSTVAMVLTSLIT